MKNSLNPDKKKQNSLADICTPAPPQDAMSLRLHRNEEFLKIQNSQKNPKNLFADICTPAQPKMEEKDGPE